MTKQDFINLANYILDGEGHGVDKFTPSQLDTLAQFCENSNSRFDREKWLNYIKTGSRGDYRGIYRQGE